MGKNWFCKTTKPELKNNGRNKPFLWWQCHDWLQLLIEDINRAFSKFDDIFEFFFLFSFIIDWRSNFQVSAAVDHVQSGNTALQKAKSLQRNSRKWMCIAIIILLIIVAVIVVGVLKPWNSNKGAWIFHPDKAMYKILLQVTEFYLCKHLVNYSLSYFLVEPKIVYLKL